MKHHHPLGVTCEDGAIVHDDDDPTHDLTHRLNQHLIYDYIRYTRYKPDAGGLHGATP